MNERHSYLGLSQFLDLERRWMDSASAEELAHRICRTAALLLDTPDITILRRRSDDRLEPIAAGDLPVSDRRGAPLREALARCALSTGTAQVKSLGDRSLGVFPFGEATAASGCLAVTIERPLFEGKEVSFLRFLASLTGVMMSGNDRSDQQPAVRPSEEPSQPTLAASRRHVAMAVHDLRNPLNVLAGYGDLLADGSLGALAEDQRRAVEAIRRQVHVLTATVGQLIDLDRMLRDRSAEENERFRVREVFDQLRSTCFLGLDERIDWPKEEAAFDTVGNRHRIGSIVQNLVDNALRHGGTEAVRVECTRADGQLLLRVRDRGAGMSPKARSSLLAWASGHEPSDATSGLGLCIVGSTVHALRGRIEVRSANSGGTVVEVYLPQAKARIADDEGSALNAGSRNAG